MFNDELRDKLSRLCPVPQGNLPSPPTTDGIRIVLSRTGAIDRPIDIIKELRKAGVRLCDAHQATTRLAEDSEAVCVIDTSIDIDLFKNTFKSMNVEISTR